MKYLFRAQKTLEDFEQLKFGILWILFIAEYKLVGMQENKVTVIDLVMD